MPRVIVINRRPQLVVKASETRLIVNQRKVRQLVKAGLRGRPGASSFESWLERNPGGTWEDFMSEIGSGAIWQESEW